MKPRRSLSIALVSAFALLPLAAPTVHAQKKPTPPPVVDALGIKLIPQPGIPLSDEERSELEAGAAALGKDIEALRQSLAKKPDRLALLPDVEVFHKAIDWALRYDEFLDKKQLAAAQEILVIGKGRAAELKSGKASWLASTGLVVRGYRSEIDGSVQPYGMVIPEDWKPNEKSARRLDFWAHGRSEKLTELEFISQRLRDPGQYTPEGAFVLHLYGRFCNANKFAGERDLFEALDHARHYYKIDDRQLVIRGFSMGGAAVWQFGTHFPGMWGAVQPGAGFAETRVFNKVYEEGKVPPTWWEETLYRWYDATDYVVNLENTTTVAYSGEIDGQKQAADIMIRYARQEAGDENPPAAEIGKVNPGDGSPSAAEARVAGLSPHLEFYHVIGPGAPHKILPEAKPEVESLVGKALAKHDLHPQRIRFVTYTLIYPDMAWVRLEGLQQHWQRAEVTAEVQGDKLPITTHNVSAIRLFSPTEDVAKAPRTVVLDGQALPVSWTKEGVTFHREGGENGKGGKWAAGLPSVAAGALRKTPTLCGPVDHAFLSSFLFVKPTGEGFHEQTAAWAKSEQEHASAFWRKVFRGDAPVKADSAVTDADIANANLVLWGDPSSNAILKKILPQLPLHWDAEKLIIGDKSYDANSTMPVMIFPNPLNPEKYVVLNSGPTFREDALLNNSQQIPKLPDWAIVDIRTAPDGKWPGQVQDAGFFNEAWRLSAQP